MILAAIVGYVALQIAIAAWASRGVKSDEGYLVANRSLGVFAVGMSTFATWFAVEGAISSSSAISVEGLAGARLDPFGFALGILVMGLFMAARLRRAGYVTLADFFRDRFGPSAEILCAFVIAASAIVWSSVQLLAFATVIANVGGLDPGLALAAATALVLTYTLLGGLLGDVVTDMVQGGVIIAGLCALFVVMLVFSGGPSAALATVPQEALILVPKDETALSRLEIWLVPLCASIAGQELISRALGARTPETARAGAVLGAGIYFVVGRRPVAFGLIGPRLGLSLSEGDAYLPSLAQSLLPGWLLVLFTGALLSAILSSVDSALLSVSAVASQTGFRRFRPHATDREALLAARAATLVAGLLAAGIAASAEAMRDLVFAAASIGACIAAPVVFGIAGRFGGAAAASTAILSSFALLAALDWTLGVPGAFVYALAGGAAAFVAVAALTPRARAR